jgi:hypothetical protein
VDRRIFISYSRVDKAYADQLVAYLTANGVPCWHDQGMTPGGRFDKQIQHELDNCVALVVVMSPDSDASTWVNNELAYAQANNKPIVPLLLNGKVFFSLGRVDFEDVRDGRMPSPRYLDRLRELVGAEVVASAPAPATAEAVVPAPATVPVMVVPKPPKMRPSWARSTARWQLLGAAVVLGVMLLAFAFFTFRPAPTFPDPTSAVNGYITAAQHNDRDGMAAATCPEVRSDIEAELGFAFPSLDISAGTWSLNELQNDGQRAQIVVTISPPATSAYTVTVLVTNDGGNWGVCR